MSAHTPGPWRTYFNGWGICDDSGHIASAESKEDARLIAAAPDLLTALKRMLQEFDFMVEANVIPDVRDDIIFSAARAAISKAEGE